MSRHIGLDDNQCLNEIEREDKEKIMECHKNLLHRGAKATLKRLGTGENTEYNEKIARKAIGECMICKMYNSKSPSRYRQIEAFRMEERIAIDIMEPKRNHYIITAIDFFTRTGFSKLLKKKSASNVLQIIKEIYVQMPFKTLVSDDAKENISGTVSKWLEENKINHYITTPCHHESNRRIERFN